MSYMRAIVFAHFDKNNIVDEYVYYYLSELRKNASHLVFVSTAKLMEQDIIKLSRYCSKVIVRENTGYDFMSYKTGLESFAYQDYNEVVICNDSVYGPIHPLKKLFEEMRNSRCDFWGVTDNMKISYHLQSYFLVFKNNVLQSNVFKTFWRQVKVLNNKDDIIEQYEVGLTQYLCKAGFEVRGYINFKPKYKEKVAVFFKKLTPVKIYKKIAALIAGKNSLKAMGGVNVTHHFWKDLLVSGRMPFVKIELLRDNPAGVDINGAYDVIQRVSGYDVKLISSHLDRVTSNSLKSELSFSDSIK